MDAPTASPDWIDHNALFTSRLGPLTKAAMKADEKASRQFEADKASLEALSTALLNGRWSHTEADADQLEKLLHRLRSRSAIGNDGRQVNFNGVIKLLAQRALFVTPGASAEELQNRHQSYHLLVQTLNGGRLKAKNIFQLTPDQQEFFRDKEQEEINKYVGKPTMASHITALISGGTLIHQKTSQEILHRMSRFYGFAHGLLNRRKIMESTLFEMGQEIEAREDLNNETENPEIVHGNKKGKQQRHASHALIAEKKLHQQKARTVQILDYAGAAFAMEVAHSSFGKVFGYDNSIRDNLLNMTLVDAIGPHIHRDVKFEKKFAQVANNAALKVMAIKAMFPHTAPAVNSDRTLVHAFTIKQQANIQKYISQVFSALSYQMESFENTSQVKQFIDELRGRYVEQMDPTALDFFEQLEIKLLNYVIAKAEASEKLKDIGDVLKDINERYEMDGLPALELKDIESVLKDINEHPEMYDLTGLQREKLEKHAAGQAIMQALNNQFTTVKEELQHFFLTSPIKAIVGSLSPANEERLKSKVKRFAGAAWGVIAAATMAIGGIILTAAFMGADNVADVIPAFSVDVDFNIDPTSGHGFVTIGDSVKGGLQIGDKISIDNGGEFALNPDGSPPAGFRFDPDYPNDPAHHLVVDSNSAIVDGKVKLDVEFNNNNFAVPPYAANVSVQNLSGEKGFQQILSPTDAEFSSEFNFVQRGDDLIFEHVGGFPVNTTIIFPNAPGFDTEHLPAGLSWVANNNGAGPGGVLTILTPQTSPLSFAITGSPNMAGASLTVPWLSSSISLTPSASMGMALNTEGFAAHAVSMASDTVAVASNGEASSAAAAGVTSYVDPSLLSALDLKQKKAHSQTDTNDDILSPETKAKIHHYTRKAVVVVGQAASILSVTKFASNIAVGATLGTTATQAAMGVASSGITLLGLPLIVTAGLLGGIASYISDAVAQNVSILKRENGVQGWIDYRKWQFESWKNGFELAANDPSPKKAQALYILKAFGSCLESFVKTCSKAAPLTMVFTAAWAPVVGPLAPAFAAMTTAIVRTSVGYHADAISPDNIKEKISHYFAGKGYKVPETILGVIATAAIDMVRSDSKDVLDKSLAEYAVYKKLNPVAAAVKVDLHAVPATLSATCADALNCTSTQALSEQTKAAINSDISVRSKQYISDVVQQVKSSIQGAFFSKSCGAEPSPVFDGAKPMGPVAA